MITWRSWWIRMAQLVGMVALAGAVSAADPVVSNVSFAQRPGTKLVDITYDLTDAVNALLAVTIKISRDAGATWDVPCMSVSGNGIGPEVTPGLGKSIVWDGGADWDGQWSEQMKVKVTANVVYMVIDLSAGPSAVSYPVSTLAEVPAGGWTDEYKTTKLVLRHIPAGTFIMGSPVDEQGRESDETQHQVTLTQDFYVGVFEVTQKQWERVMGTWPSYFTNPSYREPRPVEMVSWNAVRGGTWPGGLPGTGTFLGKLRGRTGLPLDLPTEAQWEYSCRAETITALNSGKNLTDTESCPNMAEVGRYYYNGGSAFTSTGDTTTGSAKVGSYQPNPWGLYDMHGNVWEWCLDWYAEYSTTTIDPPGAGSGSYRAERGGGWYSKVYNCRSGCRNWISQDYRNSFGFRVFSSTPAQ